MISIDTETTGVDHRHGAKPFLVTTCDDKGKQVFWEWQADPLNRQPIIPPEDIADIRKLILLNASFGAGQLIFQNAKFDFHALNSIGVWDGVDTKLVWNACEDTLLAGHCLASNLPHNLTDMGVQYLGIDITKYETAMEEATKSARDIIKRASGRMLSLFECEKFGNWMIAREGLPGMPSVKDSSKKTEDKPWKNDSWLPRAFAIKENYPSDHAWHTVTSKYANIDSAITLALWKVMRKKLVELDLWGYYKERMKSVYVAWKDIEGRGVSGSTERVESKLKEYKSESAKLGKTLVSFAGTMGFQVSLASGASVNDSMRKFCFEGLKLEQKTTKKSKSEKPSLATEILDYYKMTLPPEGKAIQWLDKLRDKRKRDTAISYLEGYAKFWVPCVEDNQGNFIIYPSLNPTGTATLRWSSSNPNSQNISKREDFNLRHCFGPLPGREWWSLDAKNIELRIPAYESGDPTMIELFERENEPPYFGSVHALNFSVVYPDIWDDLVKKVGIDKAAKSLKSDPLIRATWYQYCKNGDFALQYNAGEKTADKAFHKDGAYRLLKTKFAKLEALNQHWIRFAKKHGYVETIPDKSINPRRGYPLLCVRTEYGEILPTVPLNYHVQSTAMMLTQKSMVRCHEQLEEWYKEDGFDGFICMQIHDELVFDFPKSIMVDGMVNGVWTKEGTPINLARVRLLQKIMESGGDDIGIPTPVGVEYNPDNWSVGISF